MLFVLAQGTHLTTKANFVLLTKENWNMPPLPLLYVSQCNIAILKLTAYNYQPPLPST